MTCEVSALDGSTGFGRVITGLGPADIADEATREELRRIWLEDGLIVCRGSDATSEFLEELSHVFSELERHPIRELWTDGQPS